LRGEATILVSNNNDDDDDDNKRTMTEPNAYTYHVHAEGRVRHVADHAPVGHALGPADLCRL
jgi:hypothetical protein